MKTIELDLSIDENDGRINHYTATCIYVRGLCEGKGLDALNFKIYTND